MNPSGILKSVPVSEEIKSLKELIKQEEASGQDVSELEEELRVIKEVISQPVPEMPDEYKVGEKVYVPLDEKAFEAFAWFRLGLTEVVDSYLHDGRPGRVVKPPEDANTFWWVDLTVLTHSKSLIEEHKYDTGDYTRKIVPKGGVLRRDVPFPPPIIVEPRNGYSASTSQSGR